MRSDRWHAGRSHREASEQRGDHSQVRANAPVRAGIDVACPTVDGAHGLRAQQDTARFEGGRRRTIDSDALGFLSEPDPLDQRLQHPGHDLPGRGTTSVRSRCRVAPSANQTHLVPGMQVGRAALHLLAGHERVPEWHGRVATARVEDGLASTLGESKTSVPWLRMLLRPLRPPARATDQITHGAGAGIGLHQFLRQLAGHVHAAVVAVEQLRRVVPPGVVQRERQWCAVVAGGHRVALRQQVARRIHHDPGRSAGRFAGQSPVVAVGKRQREVDRVGPGSLAPRSRRGPCSQWGALQALRTQLRTSPGRTSRSMAG